MMKSLPTIINRPKWTRISATDLITSVTEINVSYVARWLHVSRDIQCDEETSCNAKKS
jgi:hypothetical protein